MADTMKAHARLAIGISFVATSIIGVGVVFLYWAGHSVAAAADRAILYLVIMGSVHLAGYSLYVQQFLPQSVDTDRSRASFEFSPQYMPALRDGILLQAVFGVLTALMLDMGRSFGFFKVALIGHWMGIFVIMGRRPLSPTKWDIFFIRVGVLAILTLVVLIAPIVWNVIGESHLSGFERLLGE